MTQTRKSIIDKIFASREKDSLWKVLPQSHDAFPNYLHYIPNYRASLWTLLLLADLKCDPNEPRVQKPLQTVKDHLFDEQHGIYTLKEDHFPIPCLNGNMLYLDVYFNKQPDERSRRLIDFFAKNQRFDDGKYVEPKNEFCSNTSCYGKHTCYWGVTKLLKGISFISRHHRTPAITGLRAKCIEFILKHKVCFSSRKPEKIMVNKMDLITFPNMYKSDFLEILWILKREQIKSAELNPSLDLLKSKQFSDGQWPLERKMNNMVTSIGTVGTANPFVTERAMEVLEYYDNQPVHS